MSDLLERLRAALAGRYTVGRELGSGGMATVYLALDVKHHRKVALWYYSARPQELPCMTKWARSG